METPDKWVILKLGDEPIYKVFATWMGGYLGGDAWKINSGITKIEEEGDFYLFHGYSGSVYKCRKEAYGTSGYSQGILKNILEQVKKIGSVEVMPKETKWFELNFDY